jgi:hypothetical protein
LKLKGELKRKNEMNKTLLRMATVDLDLLSHIFIHIIIIGIKIALNDADNFKDTCINTAIDAISATITSTSKNDNSYGMIAFRVQSSA